MMENLEFGDFNPKSAASGPSAQTAGSENFPIGGNIMDGGNGAKSAANGDADSFAEKNFLSLAFYQRYFDIDEDQVLARILNSAFPRRTGNFIADFVQPNPDLWGPFWICVTLVFSIAIVGNFAHFLQAYGTDLDFSSDFGIVTGATSLIYSYVTIVPALIYAYLWQNRIDRLQYSFLDLLCAYGYSLALFIPASVLCPLVPLNWVRWSIVISAAVFSGTVLVLTLWAAVSDQPNRLKALGFVLAAFSAHVLLAICLKKFFFDATGLPVDQSSSNQRSHPTIPVPVPSTEIIFTTVQQSINSTATG